MFRYSLNKSGEIIGRQRTDIVYDNNLPCVAYYNGIINISEDQRNCLNQFLEHRTIKETHTPVTSLLICWLEVLTYKKITSDKIFLPSTFVIDDELYYLLIQLTSLKPFIIGETETKIINPKLFNSKRSTWETINTTTNSPAAKTLVNYIYQTNFDVPLYKETEFEPWFKFPNFSLIVKIDVEIASVKFIYYFEDIDYGILFGILDDKNLWQKITFQDLLNLRGKPINQYTKLVNGCEKQELLTPYTTIHPTTPSNKRERNNNKSSNKKRKLNNDTTMNDIQ
jgi:hypothetical protein